MLAHLKYLSYVLRHKWHVFVACLRLGAPLHRAILHDWSKFLPSEWFPYVHHFYGPHPIQRDATGYYHAAGVGGSFDRAWSLHQHRNDHHWQHWVLIQDDEPPKLLEMPEPAIREMVADWVGAGRAQGTPNTLRWYEAHQHQLLLAPRTRQRVEELLRWLSEQEWWRRPVEDAEARRLAA